MLGGIAIFAFVVGSGLAAHALAARRMGDQEAQLCSLSAALAAGMIFLAAA